MPMLWSEPQNHPEDCYLCQTIIPAGVRKDTKSKIKYPDGCSVVKPVIFKPDDQASFNFSAMDSSISSLPSYSRYDALDKTFVLPENKPLKPHLLYTEAEFNDLARSMKLSKADTEYLASDLARRNLCDGKFVTKARTRSDEIQSCFASTTDLSYCKDVKKLFTLLNPLQTYEPLEWRLFIDASKSGLKAALVHIGNKYPSIPVGYSRELKEDYDNLKLILECIHYEDHDWYICGDFKVISILMGLQSGYTLHPCYLCLWNSRSKADHYVKKDWPARKCIQDKDHPDHNQIREPLVKPEKILLPGLHLKLGFFKAFFKTVCRTNPGVRDFIADLFPKLSEAKRDEGILAGPDIRKLIKYEKYLLPLFTEEEETKAWKGLVWICEHVLSHKKTAWSQKHVDEFLENCNKLGINMGLKMHMLHSHFDKFPKKMIDVSDEMGERFHQDIAAMERRFKGRWNESMLAEYCWQLIRETPAEIPHKRKDTKPHF